MSVNSSYPCSTVFEIHKYEKTTCHESFTHGSMIHLLCPTGYQSNLIVLTVICSAVPG